LYIIWIYDALPVPAYRKVLEQLKREDERMQSLPTLYPKTGVILVASGYVFRCPECDAVGYRPSALERIVSCEQCGSAFAVVEVRHRTSDKDLAPGVPPEALFIPKSDPPVGEDPKHVPEQKDRRKKRRGS
jgi:hypothetical protein